MFQKNILKEAGNKYQVLLNGGTYFERNERPENWLSFLTDPANLQAGLPPLALDCFDPESRAGCFKISVCFHDAMASLKSLRVEMKCSFKTSVNAFVEIHPEGDKPREWIFNIFMNTGLEHLDVSFLNTELPDLFDYLPGLKSIRLTGSRLLQVPPSFFRLSELTDLDISHCSLPEVPFQLSQLPSLTSLTFSQPCSPAVLANLRSLTSLTCLCNAFDVPREISSLTNLRFLSLGDVNTAPDDFLNFPKLEYLYFHESENSSPFNFTKAYAPGLEELNTNSTSAFVSVVSQFRNLEILIAGGKTLTESERITLCESLRQLKKLTHLSLSGLGITDIKFCSSLHSLNWIDLSNNNLVDIPQDIANLRDLKFLDLSDNSIAHLPVNLDVLYKTGSLFLKNNPIISFPDREARNNSKKEIIQKGGTHEISINTNDSFIDWLSFLADLSNLQPGLPDLTLLINYGGRTLNDVFIKASFDTSKASLSSLELSLTKFITINCNVFQNSHPDLKTKECRSWVFNLFHHTELKELRIPFFDGELPDQFASLTKLRYLDLSHLTSTILPPSFCQLCSLEVLKLNDTPLSELPRNIDQLSSLTAIDLRRTALTRLPATLFNLSKLHTLYLEETSIADFPDRFDRLQNLKDVSITLSSGAQLPDTFFRLHALEKFNLSTTSVTTLPDRFDTLSNLTTVSLHANISTLPSSLFRLSVLEELNLEGAAIAELPDVFKR